jgi:hypothetical protein
MPTLENIIRFLPRRLYSPKGPWAKILGLIA